MLARWRCTFCWLKRLIRVARGSLATRRGRSCAIVRDTVKAFDGWLDDFIALDGAAGAESKEAKGLSGGAAQSVKAGSGAGGTAQPTQPPAATPHVSAPAATATEQQPDVLGGLFEALDAPAASTSLLERADRSRDDSDGSSSDECSQSIIKDLKEANRRLGRTAAPRPARAAGLPREPSAPAATQPLWVPSSSRPLSDADIDLSKPPRLRHVAAQHDKFTAQRAFEAYFVVLINTKKGIPAHLSDDPTSYDRREKDETTWLDKNNEHYKYLVENKLSRSAEPDSGHTLTAGQGTDSALRQLFSLKKTVKLCAARGPQIKSLMKLKKADQFMKRCVDKARAEIAELRVSKPNESALHDDLDFAFRPEVSLAVTNLFTHHKCQGA